MEELWSFPYNIRTDLVLNTYGQNGQQIWEAQPLKNGEKNHERGIK